ncbi:pentatricopeptide repeat-containing protein At3g16610-like [Zingiber officinale]|nr:pentatricopeptide repeat-containing protein At3g16610-like [Zingiber officinale]
MYISCGEIESACLAFDELLQPSVFLWNAMIRAYAWNGPFGRAVELYQRMLDTGIEPNKFTFPFVLKACLALEALADGILIHEHAKKAGLELDVFVSTALLDMYLKCGCLEDAHEVFCRMPQKDVVAWNALVSGYALNGRYQGAHVIIGARNMEAANVVKENIQQSIPSAKVDVSELELSSQKSARAFADRFIERNLPLNVLINNAGVMNCPYKLSEDGIEMQFATNHLGHFLLTNLLLEKMKNIAKESRIEGRIMNLSSVAHIGI